MFFSDKLIGIGRNSNRKNNLSMATANQAMVAECNSMIASGQNPAYVKNAYKFATLTLVKEGYPFFSKTASFL